MDEIEIKQQLSDSLKLMAAFFYEPDITLLEEEKVFQNLSKLFGNLCPEACVLVDNMQRAFQNCSQQELQIAHAELFIGPYELKASPYGSTYLEKSRRVMGDSTMDVLKFYQKVGLEVDIKQPPDHIAIELEFLSYLCGLEVKALQDGDLKAGTELQAERDFFLGTYVLPWMPEFVKNLRSGTDDTFYLCLADCFEKFMQQLTFSQESSNGHQFEGMKAYADTAAD